MQKLIAITLIVLLCAVFCACTNTTEQVQNNEVAHTIPPTQDVSTQSEWVEIDCDIKLVNEDKQAIIDGEDFETFTLIGSSDDDSYIKIKLSELATQLLCSNTEPTTLYLTINSENICEVTIDPASFNGEFEFGSDLSYEKLCELATTIRGLFN